MIISEKSKARYEANKGAYYSRHLAWRSGNPEKCFEIHIRKYGITPKDYEAMFRRQRGACAICEKQNLDGRRLEIDHDHSTGKVRGLLCGRCNRILGQAKDSIKIILRAAEYLENPLKVSGGYL